MHLPVFYRQMQYEISRYFPCLFVGITRFSTGNVENYTRPALEKIRKLLSVLGFFGMQPGQAFSVSGAARSP